MIRLHSCSRIRLCLLGRLLWPCVKVNSFQFQASSVGLRRSSPLPIIHDPYYSKTPSSSKYGRVGDQLEENNRKIGPLFHTHLEAERTDNDIIVETKQKYNKTSPYDSVNDGTKDQDHDAIDPIFRVVATSDGKISALPAVRSLSPSSKSLLEKVELLYSAQTQKELRDLAYMLPRSTNNNDVQNAEYGVPRVMNGAAQEEKLVSILKQSLEDGGFKLMDQRDLDLCSALNAGYLLRLSLFPDLRDLDPCIGKEFYPELYEGDVEEADGRKYTNKGDKGNILFNNKLLFGGKVLLFRRGYSKEISNGRLLLPKLDYLQASLVQRSSSAVTKKLEAIQQNLEATALGVASKLNSAVERVCFLLLQQFRGFIGSVVENFDPDESVAGIISENTDNMQFNNNSTMEDARSFPADNTRRKKIFKLSRYRTSLSSFLPDAYDLNDALNPFLLCEPGVANATYTGQISCQYDISLLSFANSSPEQAAVRLLERVSIQNTVDFFSKQGRRDLVKNYFKSSTLVEPSYEEVIVLWRPLQKKKPKPIRFPPKWLYKVAEVFDVEDRLPKPQNNTRDETLDDGTMPLKIKAFYDVPMANIEAVLPKTRLVFRPADAIVFDLFSVFSFLAVAGSLKFDSPNLDLIAAVSLIIFAVRTFLRYSNKYARYDLLVNKFLTSKLAHVSSGALKYIVSEGNANKALRAMLTRDWLSKCNKSMTDAQLDSEQGQSYVNNIICEDSQIDIDIISALDDLADLKLVDQYEVKEEQEAQDSIRQLWIESFES